ncbi:MAG: DHH family phosphoesterase [Acutalibacteraceae bacterium]|jgi:c-di-AMP phosphodiesterase-like protein
MKPKKVWGVSVAAITFSLLLIGSVLLGYYRHDYNWMLAQLGIAGALALGNLIYQLRFRRRVRGYLKTVAARLSDAERRSLQTFPIPVAAISDTGEILWYNPSFEKEVLSGKDAYGWEVDRIAGGLPAEFFTSSTAQVVRQDGRWYRVYSHAVEGEGKPLTLLYYFDDTEHQEILEEYTLSRPAVLLVYIDNLEELLQNTRDSERAQITGKVETMLEDWVGERRGLMRRYAGDRFLVVLEQRYLDQIVQEKFPILDQARQIETAGGNVTLSIGVGRGETFLEGEGMARQALEMALGRGGDQAAVKTGSGYDFYGGVSKGVERRAKVRARVIASALADLIRESQDVLVMGHRFSDLDCLGAGAGLAAIARAMGKPAFVVCDRDTTLAPELPERYDAQGIRELFIPPRQALERITPRTLLIVTDTHNPAMLESRELYQKAATVVVVDHHRKMVGYIDNAVIFYHEPNASSASEMVTELAQYMGEGNLSRLDADALLAGIMLDTRSFVMKAGVRTFEAAAYLRRIGADTVEVKRLFSAGMEVYRRKAAIVSAAQIYRGTAIACDPRQGGKETRVAAAQAADELLSIKGVDASFTLFSDGGSINLSARSLGGFNVQLVMEALGGGGHMTMAGAALDGATMEQAVERLRQAIDRYLDEHAQKANG